MKFRVVPDEGVSKDELGAIGLNAKMNQVISQWRRIDDNEPLPSSPMSPITPPFFEDEETEGFDAILEAVEELSGELSKKRKDDIKNDDDHFTTARCGYRVNRRV